MEQADFQFAESQRSLDSGPNPLVELRETSRIQRMLKGNRGTLAAALLAVGGLVGGTLYGVCLSRKDIEPPQPGVATAWPMRYSGGSPDGCVTLPRKEQLKSVLCCPHVSDNSAGCPEDE